MPTTSTPRPVTRSMKIIGKNLKTTRLLQRLTIEQIADRAGVSRHTIMNLEAGKSGTIETLLRVTRALGMLERVTESCDPYTTDVGRLRIDEALPQRIRHKKI